MLILFSFAESYSTTALVSTFASISTQNKKPTCQFNSGGGFSRSGGL
jgi:hypothetical protein